MTWILTRLFKLTLVGFYLFLGFSMGLYAYGLIDSWGIFTGHGWLYEQWEHPWYMLGACFWFGAGALFFVRD